jgi:hypothetical protein
MSKSCSFAAFISSGFQVASGQMKVQTALPQICPALLLCGMRVSEIQVM